MPFPVSDTGIQKNDKRQKGHKQHDYHNNSSVHEYSTRIKGSGVLTVYPHVITVPRSYEIAENETHHKPDPGNNGIRLQPWPYKIRDLDIMVTVQQTDTVSIVIGCSFCPVAVDIHGVVRLSESLAILRERLSKLIEECNNVNNDNGNVVQLELVCKNCKAIRTILKYGPDEGVRVTLRN